MLSHSIKNLIKRSIKAHSQEDLYNRVSHTSWKNAILNLCNGLRRRAVAKFRLAIEHDCLRNHLYRLLFVPSSIWTLFSSGEVMDSSNLLHCPALHTTFLTKRYWEARDM
ncbi:hypothetical protein TNIN_478591 [Trichonephila inaurata madagascariensis]|uniref:Uncharacterized protein n=1 Tax=Trichonephila inaurata madagascariensis TaxID=2747483 RepID=A0A8X6XQA2_9ARAC|nr:hypothetical protein TNIN_478591 [Trichonephila inaurata madagascariensis]